MLVNLGTMPASNAYLTSVADIAKESAYPLKVGVCKHCWLVQTEDFNAPEELFTADYAYFSSSSSTWLKHSYAFSQNVIKLLSLDKNSFVVEIASNDGYLLRNFVEKHVPCLGVEPAIETAKVARKFGIPIISKFFGLATAKEITESHGKADLIVANNVLAHVPDINGFMSGIKTLLALRGTVSIEFPHLINLLQSTQFDTIYHEHFSYLSLHSVTFIADTFALKVFNVEKISTHGGSLRTWLCHQKDNREVSISVQSVMAEEISAGLTDVHTYKNYQNKVIKIAKELKEYLLSQKKNGKKIMAYGAAAKGNTLLNFAKIDSTIITKVYDIAPSKQGKLMPGSHIPIVHPDSIMIDKPDVIVILPWNIEAEIKYIINKKYDLQVTFVKAIPKLVVEYAHK